MVTINQLKQQAISDTPVLLFECLLASGDIQRWSTHTVIHNGDQYSARVLGHDLFDLQLSADDAMDGISHLSIKLANADSMLSELNSAVGFKGAQLTVCFTFANLTESATSADTMVVFRGLAGDPEEITESNMTLSFLNKLSLQRVPVPEVRIQRNCPWSFPGNPAQRKEALDGGEFGRYSRFHRCGYSADLPGGFGNLWNGEVFTSCDKSRGQCVERGMFDQDGRSTLTRRFGGFEFVPSVTNVRTSGDKTYHLSSLLTNTAKFNDAVPLVYGSGWLKAPLVFGRNDGNLTHMEVILSGGELEGLLKVVVNDVEIPKSIAGSDMNATGWYNLLTSGARTGSFDLEFVDSAGNPLGDPYGSIAVLSVVVPNRISMGTSAPNIEVLVQGLRLDLFDESGTFVTTAFSNNPAWVLLDVLRRCGWSTTDLNLQSFASAASFCGTLIQTKDANGNLIALPRYACNVVLTKRQSAASLVRGIRVASSLMLRYDARGLLELVPETTLALQQPVLPDGSNSMNTLSGGWPAYEFSDGSLSFSGIVRNADGSSSVRISARSIAELSNRLSVEFQDEANEYQQDSLSVVSQDDLALIGYEISSQSTALGLPNYNQATRVLLRQLDKLTKGNLFVEFEASFQAIKVKPGDIITITYVKEGFNRLPLRVTKLSPSTNFQTVTILAQIHNDDWYSDSVSTLQGAGRQPSSQVRIPRPLIGLTPRPGSDASELPDRFDFLVSEQIQANQDGTAIVTLSVGFSQPTVPANNAVSLPLVSLAPRIDSQGGSLPGGKSLYYALTASDDSGGEGSTSFVVRAQLPAGTNTNLVSLTGLSLPRSARTFNVYRGSTPQSLYQIDSQVLPNSVYVDTGLAARPKGLPDSSFDHANFYYRYEHAGPFRATTSSKSSVTCEDMGAVPQSYVGMAVKIIDGAGIGQERSIVSNDQTTLSIGSIWTTIPDASSQFVICEASWTFAAVTPTSPAKFQIGYRAGSVIQVSGRAANVLNHESSPELCPFTRVVLGEHDPEFGVPPAPSFTLAVPGAGEVTLSGLGFPSDRNLGSISSGTLQLHYVDEVRLSNNVTLLHNIDAQATRIQFSVGSNAFAGAPVQLGSELLSILSIDNTDQTCLVVRGILGSRATAHLVGEPLWKLNSSVTVVPFAQNFFENRASINYLHSFVLPDVRISAAEFFVSNAFGESQVQQECFTELPSRGLRTLSGGQLALQTSGSVTTQLSAAPPLIVEADHAVRDVRATLRQAAYGYDLFIEVIESGRTYCSFQIASGATESAVLDGVGLPALKKLSMLSLNVVLKPVSGLVGSATPPKDLSVTIRF